MTAENPPSACKKAPSKQTSLCCPRKRISKHNPMDVYWECSQETVRGSACQAFPSLGTGRTSLNRPQLGAGMV